MFDLVPFRKHGVKRFFDDWDAGMLSNFFNDEFFSAGMSSFKADITDEGKNYVIVAEMPGFDKEDINIEIKNNTLTISAKKDSVVDEKNDNYIRKERHFGQVSRSFMLDNVKEDEINASYKNGILRLDLPKEKEDKPKIRKIDIM